jgi:hypothetical protein
MPTSFVRDPSSVLDYAFDWTAWLTGGDTITSHTVTADDPALTVDSTDATGTVITAWLSGGVVGSTYAITCHITTTQGRTDDRTITVRVRDL